MRVHIIYSFLQRSSNCFLVTKVQIHPKYPCSHSLSLLSLSEYAPSRLRDDDPFAVVTGFGAVVELVVDAVESVGHDTVSLFPSRILAVQVE